MTLSPNKVEGKAFAAAMDRTARAVVCGCKEEGVVHNSMTSDTMPTARYFNTF